MIRRAKRFRKVRARNSYNQALTLPNGQC
jgi:hypothetical protein